MQRFHAAAILPLYNKKATIGRAIGLALASFDHAQRNGALLEQGLVVVVDDGSQDGGARVVEDLAATEPRLLLVRQANAGAAAARNTGHAAHSRPWTLLLDADDTWDKAHVLRLARLCDHHPEAGVVANAYRRVDSEGRTQHPDFARSLPQGLDGGELRRYHHATAYGAMPLSCSSAAVHRDAWGAVGGFAVGTTHGEDRIFWSKLSRTTPIAWSPVPSATYHLDAPNRSTATWEPSSARAYLRHLESSLQSQKHGPRDRRDLETALRAEHFFLGVRMAQMGFGRDAGVHQQALTNLGRPEEAAYVAKAIQAPDTTPFRPYGNDHAPATRATGYQAQGHARGARC
jgi:glycosyltransferase involved in cell wall biosynthesis